jgi:LysM repeat protein
MIKIGRTHLLLILLAFLAFLTLACAASGKAVTPDAETGSDSPTAIPPSDTPTATPTSDIPKVFTYTIQAGDTLGKIAKRHRVTVEELVQWNSIENPDVIDVDQVLTIIVSSGTAARPTSTVQPATGVIVTAEGEKITVPGVAFMDGRDLGASPALTVMEINIWNAVPRTSVLCKLRHGDQVHVSSAKRFAPEDCYYFRVKHSDCEGWLSEPFLSAEHHEPVGDRWP